MQDDRQIVKIAAINDKYKLVERPRFLVSFDTVTWESKFATSVFQKHFKTEICTFIAKGILDLLLAEAMVFSVHGHIQLGIYFIVAFGYIVYFSLATAFLFCRKRRKPRCVFLQILFFMISFIQIILIGPLVQELVFREGLEVTFAIYMMLAFLTRSFSFKNCAILITI